MSTRTTAPTQRHVAFAIAAHADDIEFMMGGTLALLAQRGWETHYMTIANGSAGTNTYSPADIVRIRQAEAQAGAKLLGATWHPSLVDDIGIIYSLPLIRQLTAIIRQVQPSIILTQAPDDYMDDHTETSRVTTSAAFNRGMPNFHSLPPRNAYSDDVTIYHSQPHGLHDQLRRLIYPGLYVDITSVYEQKRQALACHKSQSQWLDDSQGFNSLTQEMEEMARMTGKQSGRYASAEGWRRHSHIGFSARDIDPLTHALSDVSFVDDNYEAALVKRSASFH